MSKVFSIGISLLILFQSLNIHFLKLTEFIEHTKLHKERYGDNFFVFLSKHYGDLEKSHEQQHKEEEKERKSNPLQHDCNSQIQTTFVLVTAPFSIEVQKKIIEKSTNFYYNDKFSMFEKQKIFQPPRLA